MSYHGTGSTSSNNANQRTVNPQAVASNQPVAPPGFHYMPDGTLMSDADMGESYAKIINGIDLDLSPLQAAGSTRIFSVIAQSGAVFSLEIKNEDNYYYNFFSEVFQAKKSGLYNEVVNGGRFEEKIVFPRVTDNDQYDISLSAQPVTTEHAEYAEVRFGDGSLDINSITGSNSLLITKVIYQYLDQTLTISPYSIDGTVELASIVNDTITLSSGSRVNKQAFSIACSVSTAAKCYRIIKQPVSRDVIAFVGPVVGAAPITIPGENIYPTATAAFTGDDVNNAVTSGSVVDTDATDISANVAVGDKITTPVTTDTVNGDFSGGATAITMDSAVATKMAVGDQVTGTAALDAGRFMVASIDSTNVFSLSASAAIDDGTTLTFSSKVNRSLTTVIIFPLDASAFGISQAIQFRDNAPLTFFNQMNYQWPVNNFAHVLSKDMLMLVGENGIDGSYIDDYEDTITIFPNTKEEKIIYKKIVPAVTTLAKKPTIVKGEVTVQEGAVVFNKQQPLALAGDSLKVGGYGEREILRVYGYDVVFSDLAIVLTPITTTTTAAVNNSTSVPVTSVNGILDDVSTVSGIGINPKLANPTVDTGAGAATGAGTLVLTAAQTIEDGATLTFAGAGQTATITGNIEVLKAGTASQTLRFDINSLLSIT